MGEKVPTSFVNTVCSVLILIASVAEEYFFQFDHQINLTNTDLYLRFCPLHTFFLFLLYLLQEIDYLFITSLFVFNQFIEIICFDHQKLSYTNLPICEYVFG